MVNQSQQDTRAARQAEADRKNAEAAAAAEAAQQGSGGGALGVGGYGAPRTSSANFAPGPQGDILRKLYRESGVVIDSNDNVLYNPADLGAMKEAAARERLGLPNPSVRGTVSNQYLNSVRSAGGDISKLRRSSNILLVEAQQKQEDAIQLQQRKIAAETRIAEIDAAVANIPVTYTRRPNFGGPLGGYNADPEPQAKTNLRNEKSALVSELSGINSRLSELNLDISNINRGRTELRQAENTANYNRLFTEEKRTGASATIKSVTPPLQYQELKGTKITARELQTAKGNPEAMKALQQRELFRQVTESPKAIDAFNIQKAAQQQGQGTKQTYTGSYGQRDPFGPGGFLGKNQERIAELKNRGNPPSSSSGFANANYAFGGIIERPTPEPVVRVERKKIQTGVTDKAFANPAFAQKGSPSYLGVKTESVRIPVEDNRPPSLKSLAPQLQGDLISPINQAIQAGAKEVTITTPSGSKKKLSIDEAIQYSQNITEPGGYSFSWLGAPTIDKAAQKKASREYNQSISSTIGEAKAAGAKEIIVRDSSGKEQTFKINRAFYDIRKLGPQELSISYKTSESVVPSPPKYITPERFDTRTEKGTFGQNQKITGGRLQREPFGEVGKGVQDLAQNYYVMGQGLVDLAVTGGKRGEEILKQGRESLGGNLIGAIDPTDNQKITLGYVIERFKKNPERQIGSALDIPVQLALIKGAGNTRATTLRGSFKADLQSLIPARGKDNFQTLIKKIESPKTLAEQKVIPSESSVGELGKLEVAKSSLQATPIETLIRTQVKVRPVKGRPDLVEIESTNPAADKFIFGQKTEKGGRIISIETPKQTVPPGQVGIRGILGQIEETKFKLKPVAKQRYISSGAPTDELTKALSSSVLEPTARVKTFSLEELAKNPKESGRYLFGETTSTGQTPITPLQDLLVADTRNFANLGSKVSGQTPSIDTLIGETIKIAGRQPGRSSKLDRRIKQLMTPRPSTFQAFKTEKIKLPGEKAIQSKRIQDTFASDLLRVSYENPFADLTKYRQKSISSIFGRGKKQPPYNAPRTTGKIGAGGTGKAKAIQLTKEAAREIVKSELPKTAKPETPTFGYPSYYGGATTIEQPRRYPPGTETKQPRFKSPQETQSSSTLDALVGQRISPKTPSNDPFGLRLVNPSKEEEKEELERKQNLINPKTKFAGPFSISNLGKPRSGLIAATKTRQVSGPAMFKGQQEYTGQVETLIPRLTTPQKEKEKQKTITTQTFVPYYPPDEGSTPGRFDFPGDGGGGAAFPYGGIGSGGRGSKKYARKKFVAYGISAVIPRGRLPGSFQTVSSSPSIFRELDKRERKALKGRSRKGGFNKTIFGLDLRKPRKKKY